MQNVGIGRQANAWDAGSAKMLEALGAEAIGTSIKLTRSTRSLRDSLWLEAMSEQYMDVAFAQTRELDPTSVFVLNEYDIDLADPYGDVGSCWVCIAESGTI